MRRWLTVYRTGARREQLLRGTFVTSLATLLAAAAPARTAADATRYHDCLAAVRDAPARAADLAAAWRLDGGGLPARHCLALALTARGQPAAARAELESAARAAEASHDPLTPALWGQAGNAALLANDPTHARAHLTAALLAGTTAAPGERAGWLLDRARAEVALGLYPAARTDLDAALSLTPEDPLARTLSAALALRDGDLARARRDIAEAKRLAPADEGVVAQAARIDTAASAGTTSAGPRDYGDLRSSDPIRRETLSSVG